MHTLAAALVADPLLVSLAFLVAIGEATILSWCFTRMGGVFAKAVERGPKITSIEGLRGLLAFSVVVHHGCCWYFLLQRGAWTTGHSIIFARLATFGVIQFFYISGYLFWRKLMRRGEIPLKQFYLSRFVRIGPVYYVCVGAALLIGVVVTGTGLHVGVGTLARSVASWLLFTLGGRASVNGADTQRITAGVTWTLAMEWGFYLLLPFLGWFSRSARRLVWYAVVFGGVLILAKLLHRAFLHQEHLLVTIETLQMLARFLLIGFGGGILVAALEPQLKAMNRLSARAASWIVLALYAAYLLVPGIESAGQILLLAAFALIVQGTDLFGLLASRGVRLLGIVSYPIYVAHGLVYYLASRVRGGIHPVPLRAYIPQTLLCLVIIVIVATAIHFAIERPTMLISERLARSEKPTEARRTPIAA